MFHQIPKSRREGGDRWTDAEIATLHITTPSVFCRTKASLQSAEPSFKAISEVLLHLARDRRVASPGLHEIDRNRQRAATLAAVDIEPMFRTPFADSVNHEFDFLVG
ncbi:hypothetical protein A6U87_17290 [Rhizobium sp. AC44/96]|nr:hypothetical protein A6U87_17290 [Rhizobium sp. AC44/96]